VALFRQHSFIASGISSLCWRGDELVDWVSGGRAFALDGTEQRSGVYYAYSFDAAKASPDGRLTCRQQRENRNAMPENFYDSIGVKEIFHLNLWHMQTNRPS